VAAVLQRILPMTFRVFRETSHRVVRQASHHRGDVAARQSTFVSADHPFEVVQLRSAFCVARCLRSMATTAGESGTVRRDRAVLGSVIVSA
jgi:hypothetical protein